MGKAIEHCWQGGASVTKGAISQNTQCISAL